MIEIFAYPHETKVFVCTDLGITVGVIDKREINEFDFVNYAIKVEGKRNRVWLTEDQIFTDLDDYIENIRPKLKNKLAK